MTPEEKQKKIARLLAHSKTARVTGNVATFVKKKPRPKPTEETVHVKNCCGKSKKLLLKKDESN
jgi:hypothetical protein